MSTKVYTGYKLIYLGMIELQHFCLAMQREFIKERNDHLRNMFTKDRYDWAKLNNYAMEDDIYMRRSTVDFKADVVFFPTTDINLLAITFWGHRGYTKVWEKSNVVSPYWWWDNVDPDENCSAEEWEQRGKHWKEVLKGNGVPAENGFTFSLMPVTLPLPQELWPEDKENREHRC